MSANEKNQMHEQVSNVITGFLKQRKYTESESSLKDFSVEHKMEAMAFKTTVCNESGVPDVFSFAINSSDPAMLDEQFSSLKSFITGTNPAYRVELSKFLFPMFANIYLDLVAKGQMIHAQTLFTKHSGDFSIEHKEEIQHLQAITDLERLKSSDTASNFRRSKFVVKLSNKVFTYFLQFLRSGDHVLLLHLLNKHFSIEISHSKPGQKQTSDEMETDETEAPTTSYRATRGGKQAKSNAEKENESLVALKESIGHIRNGPACRPSVCFYSFVNAYQGYGLHIKHQSTAPPWRRTLGTLGDMSKSNLIKYSRMRSRGIWTNPQFSHTIKTKNKASCDMSHLISPSKEFQLYSLISCSFTH